MAPRWLIAPAVLAASTSGYATTYLDVAGVQAALFPGVALAPVAITLTGAQRAAVQKASGVRVRDPALQAWRAPDGSWLLIDRVLGKHEDITYAVALSAAGAVRGVEIMEYRETYGGEIRHEKWRAQFAGKTAAAPLKLDEDIKNITGATLSCRHVTDGVKRLLATHEIALKPLR